MLTLCEVSDFASDQLGMAVLPEGVTLSGTGQADLPDATTKCEIRTGDFRGFMLVSAAREPHLVARNVANIERVAARLPAGIDASVLRPLASGDIAGRSAAIWNWHRPLVASNRLVRRARLRWHRAALLDWAYDFMVAGLGPQAGDNMIASRFSPLLERVADSPDYDADIRQDARNALARLDSGRWKRLFTAIEHGDLWPGNFLLAEGEGTPYYVIDWAGAQLDGYPVFDLARLSLSLRVDQDKARRIARRFAEALDCTPEDLIGYALCSLSDLSTRLEHFPPDRFHAMARDVYRQVRDMAA